MIFVTIGTLLPFDRLIRLVDGLAPSLPERPFFAQIGKGAYEPRNMDYARHLAPSAFGDKVRQASLIVAHAGMGSVITGTHALLDYTILMEWRGTGMGSVITGARALLDYPILMECGGTGSLCRGPSRVPFV